MIAALSGTVAYFDARKAGALAVHLDEDDDGIGSLPVVGFADANTPLVLLPWRKRLIEADAIPGYIGLGRDHKDAA